MRVEQHGIIMVVVNCVDEDGPNNNDHDHGP